MQDSLLQVPLFEPLEFSTAGLAVSFVVSLSPTVLDFFPTRRSLYEWHFPFWLDIFFDLPGFALDGAAEKVSDIPRLRLGM